MLVRVVYELSDRRGFFHEYVGFPFRPFTDLLCIHGYHPALYTIEPPLSGQKSMPRNYCSKEWEIKPLLSGHLYYTFEPTSGHPPLSGQ